MSLTERELLMLQDHLSLHAAMTEKAGFFSSQTTDPELRMVLQQLQRGHARHVDTIALHITQLAAAGGGIGQGVFTVPGQPVTTQ